MWPVKLRSAADSSHGDDARTIAPMPAVHAHKRHPAAWGRRTHARPYTATAAIPATAMPTWSMPVWA
jgi:hypothetical protein